MKKVPLMFSGTEVCLWAEIWFCFIQHEEEFFFGLDRDQQSLVLFGVIHGFAGARSGTGDAMAGFWNGLEKALLRLTPECPVVFNRKFWEGILAAFQDISPQESSRQAELRISGFNGH